MIHEYAMDPEFLLELAGQKFVANTVLREFGVGRPCVLAGYPETWAASARALVQEELARAKEPKKIAKLQETIKQVSELAADFAGPNKKRTKRHGAAEWAGSFAEEHRRFPFAGILSGKGGNTAELPIRDMDWLRSSDCPLFLSGRGAPVQRTERGLYEALRPFLQNAGTLTFVDPYFFPEDRYKKPYRLYFEAISKSNHVRAKGGRRELLIVCAAETDSKNPVSPGDFAKVCNARLPEWLPDGLALRLHRIKRREGGQEIHNRYILADIGGVSLGHGTDVSRNPGAASYDDISLLDETQWSRWRLAYAPGSPFFDWSEPPVGCFASRA